MIRRGLSCMPRGPDELLLGTCVITSVRSADLAALWHEFGSRSELSFHEFQQYFEGVAKGTALTLSEPQALTIPLQDLRAKPRRFRPPQSFAYVDTKTGNQLIRMGLAQDSTTKSTGRDATVVSLSFRFQSERGSAATTGWLGDRWTMRHSRNALARSSGVFHQVSLTREESRTHG